MKNQNFASKKKGMTALEWIYVTISGIYVISPIDFIPDTIPVVGWVDDILIGLGGISTLIKSQLTETNDLLVMILKIIRSIGTLIWIIIGLLVLIFGAMIYEIIN